jgi:hypothetical protein
MIGAGAPGELKVTALFFFFAVGALHTDGHNLHAGGAISFDDFVETAFISKVGVHGT